MENSNQKFAYAAEDEINLLDSWRVIWKRRKLIGGMVIIAVFATAIISLFMTNIYRSEAVLMPVESHGSQAGGLGMLAQQLGQLQLPGSSPTTSSEIVSLLKSNILREKVVYKNNLMPVLFYKQWDEKRQAWKKEPFSLVSPVSLLTKVVAPNPPKGTLKKDPDTPDIRDALRLLDKIVNIKDNIKQSSITISVDFHDPDMAARLVNFLLEGLTDHMSSEAKRVADTNKKYLEEQLGSTADPLIRQKTYNLIAQQIEQRMMAEVKENFAFKVIDPPLVPDKKIKPKRTLMVLLALIVALFAGIFWAFFLEYLEKLKRSEDSEMVRGDKGDG